MNQITKALCLWRSLVCAPACAGCGKRRPPLPPVERVQQRTELLSGAQQGNEVILSWPAPRRNAPDAACKAFAASMSTGWRKSRGRRWPYRRRIRSPLHTDWFSHLRRDQKPRATRLPTLTRSNLPDEPTRLRYAIRYVNASGQRAAFSNFLRIEPAARIAQAAHADRDWQGNQRRRNHDFLAAARSEYRWFNAGESARLQRLPS